MKRLEGKVALVTGAGSGFGQGIAETFAREGARVAVVDIDEGAARAVASALGEGAVALTADVAKASDVDGVVRDTLAAFGGLDIVVNNAGISHRNRPMLEVDEAEFDRVFAVNVKSLYLFARAAVPVMRERGGGVFINVGSTAGLRPRPGLTWYNGTKGAVQPSPSRWRWSSPPTISASAPWRRSPARRRCSRPSWARTRRRSGRLSAARSPSDASRRPRTSPTPRCSWHPTRPRW